MSFRYQWVILLSLLGILCPWNEVMAQDSQRTAAVSPPQGVGIGIRLGGVGAFLDDGTKAIFSPKGSPNLGGSYGFDLGYDVGRMGGSVGVELGAIKTGDEIASLLSLIAMGHWRPPVQVFTGWQPILSGGYVRHGFGGLSVRGSNLPPEVRPSIPDALVNTSVIGNGVRLGMGAEKPISARGRLSLGLSIDVVRFTTLSAAEEGDVSRKNPGSSAFPRLDIGFRWWPFGHSW